MATWVMAVRGAAPWLPAQPEGRGRGRPTSQKEKISSMTEPRSLPCREDSEKGLLCSMIGGAEARTECLRSFRPEMFYIPAHRILFQTLAALTEKEMPIDFRLVKESMARGGQLDEIGGVECLSAIWGYLDTDRFTKLVNQLIVN